MKKKTALITGVCGQDGSYIADLLLKKDYNVFGMMRRNATKSLGNAKHLENEIEIVEGDITDMSSMLRIIQQVRPHELYNMSAMSHVHTSFEQPLATLDIDTKGVINILECIKGLGYSTRIIHASTSEMFGSSPPPQNLETVLTPESPYAIAKVASHHFIRLYRKAYNMFCCAGVTFNHESLAGFMPIIFMQENQIDIKPISEIAINHTNKKAIINLDEDKYQECNVTEDLYVWDSNGWTKVKFASGYPHKGNKNPKFIISKNAAYMATGNHVCIMNDKTEKKTKDIMLGDKINLITFPSFCEDKNMSKEIARLMGFIVGDGYICENNKVKIIGKNCNLLNKYSKIWKNLGKSIKIEKSISGFSNKKDIFNYHLLDNDIFNRSDFYTNDRKKRIPKIILNSSIDIKKEFLNGYNDADGLKKNNCVYNFKNFKTNSATLASGLIFLLNEVTSQNFCINVEVSTKWGRVIYYYSINIQSDSKWSISKSKSKYKTCKKLLNKEISIKRIHKNTGISESFIRKVSRGYIPPNNHHLEIPNNVIKKIINIPNYDGWFFDLETESGTFSCGLGKVHVHNSERRGPLFVTRKITLGVANCLKDPKFKLKLGNLDAQRDWGYAPDFVKGFHLVLQQEKPDDYIFATNETHSVREFCEEAFGYAGLNWEDHVEFDRFFMRPAEVDALCGDYSVTKEKIGWEPETKFKDLVKKMVDHDCKLLGVEKKEKKLD